MKKQTKNFSFILSVTLFKDPKAVILTMKLHRGKSYWKPPVIP
jgi:hypothetical protein